jgi:hypothetical protein
MKAVSVFDSGVLLGLFLLDERSLDRFECQSYSIQKLAFLNLLLIIIFNRPEVPIVYFLFSPPGAMESELLR